MNRTMSKENLYNIARHYGAIVNDTRTELNGVFTRVTEFEYNGTIVTSVLVNGEVVYCDYHKC